VEEPQCGRETGGRVGSDRSFEMAMHIARIGGVTMQLNGIHLVNKGTSGSDLRHR
jgi:hypothetical protein